MRTQVAQTHSASLVAGTAGTASPLRAPYEGKKGGGQTVTGYLAHVGPGCPQSLQSQPQGSRSNGPDKRGTTVRSCLKKWVRCAAQRLRPSGPRATRAARRRAWWRLPGAGAGRATHTAP